MKSLGAMIKQLDGLADGDLSTWEGSFIPSIVTQTRNGEDTSRLSEKQIEIVEKMYKKHFGD